MLLLIKKSISGFGYFRFLNLYVRMFKNFKFWVEDIVYILCVYMFLNKGDKIRK